MMKKTILGLLAGVAFAGVASLPSSAFAEAAVPWFAEDAATFSSNAEGRWTADAGVAVRAGDVIKISQPEDNEDAALVYAPSAVSASSAVIDTKIRFLGGCRADAPADERDFMGIQLIEDSDASSDAVWFALLDAAKGNDVWLNTGVAATLNVYYDIRVTIDIAATPRLATYWAKLATASDYTRLGAVVLPARATIPEEVVYTGYGELMTLDGATQGSQPVSGYDRWLSTVGIVTWRGYSKSTAKTLDFSAEGSKAGRFTSFDSQGGSWSEDLTTVWTGSVQYAAFPGYSGTATEFWHAFASSYTGYSAPGLALRFVPNDGTIAGGCGLNHGNFNVGGLIVETGATGYSLGYVAEMTKQVRKTLFGDPTGAVTSFHDIREDFAVIRGVADGSETRFYGTNVVTVAAGRVFSVNTATSVTNVPAVLDPTTHAALVMCGDGAMAFGSALTARGAVTLDYSNLSEDRIGAFIRGDLILDASTSFAFPSCFTNGATLKLCTGSLRGAADGVYSVTVTGVCEKAYLAFDAANGCVTRGSLLHATVSGDVDFGAIVWDGGAAWSEGAAVSLTFDEEASVTFREAVSLGDFAVDGAANPTFVFAAMPTFARSLTVPEGKIWSLVTAEATEGSPRTLSTPITVNGTLRTYGYWLLDNAANRYNATGRFEVLEGKTTVGGNYKMLGADTLVAAGATLAFATTDYVNYDKAFTIDVYGTLDMGEQRMTVAASHVINAYPGAVLTGAGQDAYGAFDFAATTSQLNVLTDAGDAGEVHLSGAVRARGTYAVNVAAGMTLVMDGVGVNGSGHNRGFTKTGAGTVRVEGDYSGNEGAVTVSAGTLELAGGIPSKSIVIANGATLKGHATTPIVLNMNDRARYVADGTPLLATLKDGAFTQGGDMIIDASALADGDVVLSAPTGSAFKPLRIYSVHGDARFVVEDANLVCRKTTWGSPRVFTWETASSDAAVGLATAAATYTAYDPIAGTEGTVTFTGNGALSDYNLTQFWHAWAFNYASFVPPGAIWRLRSAASGAYATQIGGTFTPFTLGGLLMEAGASDVTFIQTSGTRETVLGDPSGQATATFQLTSNVTVNRTGCITLAGTVVFDIASGKTFDLNTVRNNANHDVIMAASCTFASSLVSRTAGGTLIAKGAGGITVHGMTASGATLDFSNQDLSRETPYVTGNLTVDDKTTYAFPAGLAENKSYVLCSGTLTAPTKSYEPIRLGDGEPFWATLTYGSNYVQYAKSVINTATLSQGTTWQDIDWNAGAGWKGGRVASITLEDDLVINVSDVASLPSIIVLSGEHGVMITGSDDLSGVEIRYEDGAYATTFDFIWVGGATGRWADGSNWNTFVAPGPGDTVYFKTSVTALNAGSAMCGELHLSDGVTVAATIADSSEIEGLVGGTLKIAGTGTLRIRNAASGYTLDGATLAADGGTVILGPNGANANFRDVTLRSTASAKILTNNRWMPFSGTLTVASDEDATILAPSAEGAMESLLQGSATLVKTGSGTVTIGSEVGRDGYPYGGAIRVDAGTLLLGGSRNGLTTLYNRFNGALSGSGCFGAAAGAQVMLPRDAVTAGGFAGDGLICFSGCPTAAVRKGLQKETWCGTAWLKDLTTLGTFSPSDFGNDNSVVRFSSCSGDLRHGTYRVKPAVELLKSGTATALTLAGPTAHSEIDLTRLRGDGELRLETEDEADAETVLAVSDPTRFTGSLTLARGEIALHEDISATIDEEATWTIDEGSIALPATATLTDDGHIAASVTGAGTVRYTGTLTSDKIEPAARFEDASAWTGTVVVADAQLSAAHFDTGANAGSSLVVDGAEGFLSEEEIDFPIVLTNAGWTVNGPFDGHTVTMEALVGNGPFTFAEGNATVHSVYNIRNILDFYGSLIVNAGAAGCLLGDCTGVTAPEPGMLAFAPGAHVPTGRDWHAQVVRASDSLVVHGDLDQPVVETLEIPDAETFETGITAVDGDVRVRYRFRLTSGYLYVIPGATSPKADVESLDVVYGTDLTNATICVTVTNYWEGIDYETNLFVRVTVRDLKGRYIDVVGGWVSGNGTYAVGCLDLPDASGKSYVYEVSCEAQETPYSHFDEVSDHEEVDVVSYLTVTNWIDETSQTLPLPAKAAGKTGDWTSEGSGQVAVQDGAIVFTAGTEPLSWVDFKPYVTNVGDIATINFDLDLSGDGAVSDVEECFPADAEPLASMLYDTDDDGSMLLKVYDPETKQYFEAESAAAGSHRYAAVLDYANGTLWYTVDNRLLACTGRDSVFKLPAAACAAHRVNNVRFVGGMTLDRLLGVQRGLDMAAVGSGDDAVTFRTVDEAVAYAHAHGLSDVSLLWDATWRPQTNDVGRTIRFTGDGHTVYVDGTATNGFAREGYRFLDNGDGSYTVGVLTFRLSFDGNGFSASGYPDTTTTGPVPVQTFSVTNMCLTLASNVFRRVHYDFTHWNLADDDTGAESWTDGAKIDLTPYGLTNRTLYAQWEIAKRTIVVAAADEFVYVERVETNAPSATPTAHAGVRFYTDRSAQFDVRDGTEFVIRFSTDIGRRLTVGYLKGKAGDHDVTYLHETLPSNLVANALGKYATLSPMQTWAATRGITSARLSASPYATASYRLDGNDLLDETTTEVRITDFAVTSDACTFRVTIDGEAVTEASLVAEMVQVSSNLKDWAVVAPACVSVTDGLVTVTTGGDGRFIRIVVPKDAN